MPYAPRFYSMIYQNFRDGKYDDGFKGLNNYRINKTSPTSFRKIYSQLVTVLDRIIESSAQDKAGVQDQLVRSLVRSLVRLNILLEYQKKRGVVDEDLADGIKQALDEVRASLQQPSNLARARELAIALRDSLDSFLAYVIYGKKGGEEYEF
jgi:CRISPR/Cas system CSM-associated protein Csm2 small subunit